MSYLEGDTLPAVLKVRRKDLFKTPRAMSGLKMGQYLIGKFGRVKGRSGAWISNLENGTADWDRLDPEVKLALLRLYHFTDDELLHLDERFDLRLPLSVKNPTSENPTTLDKLPSQTITGVGAGGFRDVNVTDFATAGRKLEDVIQVHAENGILVSREVNVPEGAFVYFDKTQKPAPGKTVLYQVRGHDRFIMLSYREQLGEQFVTSFDSKTGMSLAADDPPLDLLGVMFAMTSFEPKG